MVLPSKSSAPLSQRINPAILREYDIRGIVGESLNDKDAWNIGRAFASVVRAEGSDTDIPKICIGYDGRTSSPALESALIDGITKSGADVIRIGCGPTPMLYYSVYKMDAAGGIMVTGSHNPPTHNGFKFMLGRRAFFGDAIRNLGTRINSEDYSDGRGKVTIADEIESQYVTRLLSAYGENGGAGLKVAWDAGNGAAGNIVQQLCERLPGRHIPLFTEINGSFPNHHPDPTIPQNLAHLMDVVRREKCDLGIAFDGDGDRIGVVDGDGKILWADQLLLLYAQEVLRTHTGATVIADVKASQSLFDGIRKLGGKPLMWKTGHSHIKSRMQETGAPLAGEMSGHIFFADDYYGFDDGLYAAIRLLRILATGCGMPLTKWRSSLPVTFATPEIRFPCPDERKFAVIEEVASRLEQNGAEFTTIDGVRVKMSLADGGSGWWLLRASNTQAALSARCEANSEKGLAELKNSLREQLSACDLELP